MNTPQIDAHSAPVPAPTYAGQLVSAQLGTGFRTGLRARSHRLHADEPLGVGGTDTGMTPYELLLASLSSCMVLTMRMYADRKGWPLDGEEVHLRTAPSKDADSEEIADRCPVKCSLEEGLQVVRAVEE